MVGRCDDDEDDDDEEDEEDEEEQEAAIQTRCPPTKNEPTF